MTAGLWPQIQAGSPPAVSAAIRVSERRSRLLGLDEPVVTKTELTGALGIYAEKLRVERELFGTLTLAQMEEVAGDSQALIDKVTAMATGNAGETQRVMDVSPLSVAAAADAVPSQAAEEADAASLESAPRD